MMNCDLSDNEDNIAPNFLFKKAGDKWNTSLGSAGSKSGSLTSTTSSVSEASNSSSSRRQRRSLWSRSESSISSASDTGPFDHVSLEPINQRTYRCGALQGTHGSTIDTTNSASVSMQTPDKVARVEDDNKCTTASENASEWGSAAQTYLHTRRRSEQRKLRCREIMKNHELGERTLSLDDGVQSSIDEQELSEEDMSIFYSPSEDTDLDSATTNDNPDGTRNASTRCPNKMSNDCILCKSLVYERQQYMWRSRFVRSSLCRRCTDKKKSGMGYISYWGKDSYELGSWRKRLKAGRETYIDLTPLIEVLAKIDAIDAGMGKPNMYERRAIEASKNANQSHHFYNEDDRGRYASEQNKNGLRDTIDTERNSTGLETNTNFSDGSIMCNANIPDNSPTAEIMKTNIDRTVCERERSNERIGNNQIMANVDRMHDICSPIQRTGKVISDKSQDTFVHRNPTHGKEKHTSLYKEATITYNANDETFRAKRETRILQLTSAESSDDDSEPVFNNLMMEVCSSGEESAETNSGEEARESEPENSAIDKDWPETSKIESDDTDKNGRTDEQVSKGYFLARFLGSCNNADEEKNLREIYGREVEINKNTSDSPNPPREQSGVMIRDTLSKNATPEERNFVDSFEERRSPVSTKIGIGKWESCKGSFKMQVETKSSENGEQSHAQSTNCRETGSDTCQQSKPILHCNDTTSHIRNYERQSAIGGSDTCLDVKQTGSRLRRSPVEDNGSKTTSINRTAIGGTDKCRDLQKTQSNSSDKKDDLPVSIVSDVYRQSLKCSDTVIKNKGSKQSKPRKLSLTKRIALYKKNNNIVRKAEPSSKHASDTTSPSDEEDETDGFNGNALELQIGQSGEETELSWRTRGYNPDFFMSRQSVTGSEIIDRFNKAVSNRREKHRLLRKQRRQAETNASSSAPVSRKSSQLLKPDTHNSESRSRLRSNSEGNGDAAAANGGVLLNVDDLNRALERADKCSARMSRRLDTLLKM